jgi:hypothetical protein
LITGCCADAVLGAARVALQRPATSLQSLSRSTKLTRRLAAARTNTGRSVPRARGRALAVVPAPSTLRGLGAIGATRRLAVLERCIERTGRPHRSRVPERIMGTAVMASATDRTAWLVCDTLMLPLNYL